VSLGETASGADLGGRKLTIFNLSRKNNTMQKNKPGVFWETDSLSS